MLLSNFPIPPSFPSLPKNCLGVQPYVSIFPLEVSQKHYWTCAGGYTHFTLSLIVKNPHPILAYHILGSCSWNYHLFHWIFWMACNYDGFIYLFIFNRLIIHNSKDKFRLKMKKKSSVGFCLCILYASGSFFFSRNASLLDLASHSQHHSVLSSTF